MKTIHEANSRRRDKVVEKARLRQDSDSNLEKAQAILARYQRERHKNNTPERKLTLEMLYRLDSPIDIETLADMMAEAHPEMTVCRTTVYNNLLMFVDAHLARKVQLLGNPRGFFEKTIGVEDHGYCICQGCGAIRNINLSHFTESIRTQLPKTFRVFDFDVCVTGLCYKCQASERKALKAKSKAIKESLTANRAKKARGNFETESKTKE